VLEDMLLEQLVHLMNLPQYHQEQQQVSLQQKQTSVNQKLLPHLLLVCLSSLVMAPLL
jgi:hypothetical protein